MEIRLLGPELEHVQSDARKEIDETIERRKREVENEVIASLSEIASDGKRVLKSQKPTYEMMLQLDGLVKENEELFLKVNALCDKTGVSLNAIIERMVTKNRELREKEIVNEPENIVATPVEIPVTEEINKKKDSDNLEVKFSNIETSNKNTKKDEFEMPHIELEYDPNIVFDWQKPYLENDSSTIKTNENIPVSSAPIKPVVPTFDMPNQIATEPVKNNVSYLRVTGRRLHTWSNKHAKNDSLLRVTIFGEDFTNKSEDYRNLSTQIGNLLLHYKEFSPEEDNITLDTLDQSIGASKIDVPEKRKLYRKLNFGAKRIENYARAS